MRFIEDKVKSSRNFANKIWNAARFIMMNLPDDFKADKLPENLNVEDKWVISKFNTLAKEVNDNLEIRSQHYVYSMELFYVLRPLH